MLEEKFVLGKNFNILSAKNYFEYYKNSGCNLLLSFYFFTSRKIYPPFIFGLVDKGEGDL